MDQARGRLLSLKNFEVGAIPSVLKMVIRCVAARELVDH
jgi:hypothetical protein